MSTEEQISLPKFIVRQPDGLYLTLPTLDSPQELQSFVDSIFSSAMCFAELNYAVLQSFLYEYGPDDIAKLAQEFEAAGRPPLVKLANAVVSFPLMRQKCYRDPKLIEQGDAAEYIFEPVFVEREGDSEQADGEGAGTVERITLNVDEFIAAMWCKAVRFGIDVAAVEQALGTDTSVRVEIARMREPTAGKDASVVELLSMRRDNAPKMLPDGRVDLHQFENRFPQMEMDTKLVKKVPRVLGKSGWGVAGNEIAPELPLDFDLATLAGLGTRIERTADGEFVVANLGGFLKIDGATKSLSITEKIINTEGVSVRTTGNLALRGDEYEEHGVVQEKAQIEGKHMTFMADVFGDIVSNGGRVVLRQNLVAGSIKNSAGGSITVDGNASRATVEVPGGEITLQYAENCRIIGAKVTIEKAVFCDVLAQELTVGSSEGSALAAEIVRVGTAEARRDVETTISMLVPDMSHFAAQIEELNRRQREAALVARHKRVEVETITGQADIKTFMLLSGKVASKELVMTAEQTANFQRLTTRLAPDLKRLKALNEELRAASGTNDTLVKKIQDAKRAAARNSTGIACSVTEIAGDTVIRTLVKPPPQAGLELLPPRELRARLRESGADSEVLFSGSSGEFAWRMVEEDESESAD